MSQRNSGVGHWPVTRCSTTAAGTGSVSTRTRISASSNIVPTLPVGAVAAPHRAAPGAAT